MFIQLTRDTVRELTGRFRSYVVSIVLASKAENKQTKINMIIIVYHIIHNTYIIDILLILDESFSDLCVI